MLPVKVALFAQAVADGCGEGVGVRVPPVGVATGVGEPPTVHSGNLNEPMRVCQPRLLV